LNILKFITGIFAPRNAFEIPVSRPTTGKIQEVQETTRALQDKIDRSEKPETKPKGEPKVSELAIDDLILSRKVMIFANKVHYIDSKDGETTLCGEKIYRMDTIVPLVKDGEVREISCKSCSRIVNNRSKHSAVKIARVPPKPKLKRGKPVKEKTPVDDGIISIHQYDPDRDDPYHPMTPDIEQLPFSIRPHKVEPVIPPPAHAVKPVGAMFSQRYHNFGSVELGQNPIQEIKIVNPWNEEVRIGALSGTKSLVVWLYAGGGTTRTLKDHMWHCSYAIAPHSETSLYIQARDNGLKGHIDETIRVDFERPAGQHMDIHVMAHFVPAITPSSWRSKP
jgi:hypothetical protein